jgi:hypothetical protein
MMFEDMFVGDDHSTLPIHQISYTAKGGIEINFGGLIRELEYFFLHASVKKGRLV